MLQALRVGDKKARLRAWRELDGYVLRRRRRTDDLDGVADDALEVGRLELQPQVAGDDAGDIEDVVDDFGLGLRVAVNHVRRLCHVRVDASAPQQRRPADDRVERRS